MVICAVPASFSCQPTLLAVEPTAESVTLTNGLRVAAVYFSGSTNVAIFTHLPMSLTSDGPRQSQWAQVEVVTASTPDAISLAVMGSVAVLSTSRE